MSGASHLHTGGPRTERRRGLPVTVVELRRNGERITGAEFAAAERHVGRLLLGPTDRHRSGGGATHMADLLKPGHLELGSVLQPLFNPIIEIADSRGFVLSGYVTRLEGGALVKIEQVWFVRPLAVADLDVPARHE